MEKITNNAIEEQKSDGTKFIRWNPTPAHLTDIAMQELHADYLHLRDNAKIDPADIACLHLMCLIFFAYIHLVMVMDVLLA